MLSHLLSCPSMTHMGLTRSRGPGEGCGVLNAISSGLGRFNVSFNSCKSAFWGGFLLLSSLQAGVLLEGSASRGQEGDGLFCIYF